MSSEKIKDNVPAHRDLSFPAYRFIYDFEFCVGLDELKQTIRTINDNGYNLVCVTQCEDTYTVFFRRFTGG